MGADFLVPLIVGVLGFIYKAIQEHNQKVSDDPNTHTQELREALEVSDPGVVSGVLSDQHDRMLEAIRCSSRS